MASSVTASRKRRRERDRPKARPDASYNPNKRILLSYASDEEGDETPASEQLAGTGYPPALDTVTSNYEISTYRDDAEESSDQSEQHIAEDASFSAGPDGDENVEGRAEESEDGLAKAEGQIRKKDGNRRTRAPMRDPETGQQPVLGFGQYSDEDEEESGEGDDGATKEAMAYLRGVRSEREILPTVFAAPADTENEELYESGIGDARGYVSQGAYIGRPKIGVTMPEYSKTSIEPQEAYTRSLKKNFLEQHQRLHSDTRTLSLAALDDRHRIIFNGHDKARAKRQELIQTTVPLPAQVHAMNQDTVYDLLELIQRFCLVRCKEITNTTSVWVWSLLARLDAVGTMSNREASAVREFGKRAILVQLSFYDPVAAQQLEQMEMNGEDVAHHAVVSSTGDDEAGEHAHEDASQRSQQQQGTLVTLDMIIAIIGDVFGQRDLLEFRREWTTPEAGVE